MPTEHLKFGGSTATRTLHCPAWVGLAEKLPQVDRTSAAAERGTKLHDAMESIYDEGIPLEQAIADAGLDIDDADAVRTAHQATEQYLDDIGAEELVCEEMVKLAPDIGGSADMIAAAGGVVAIIDYKFGYMPVTETDQFLLYAISGRNTPAVADLFEGKAVQSVIIQPAVSAEPIVHKHSARELDDFERRFLLAVERARSGTATPQPGDWCTFCPAAPTCPAKRQQVAGFLSYDPKQQQQLADAMGLVDAMKAQIKAIEAEVFLNLEAGKPVPGWKLVAKRSTRKWADENKIIAALKATQGVTRKHYIEEKLRSPAQIEKTLKGKFDVSEYVTQNSSGNTIAPETDKREAVQPLSAGVPDSLARILGAKTA